jgi:ABC-type glycerol-3-phosphate transport system permease component
MAAATMVAILPLFILALLVQRYMIRGLTFGAVK